MKIIHYLTTFLVLLLAFGGGISELLKTEQIAEAMRDIGYPLYAASVLGIFKVAGGVFILLNLLKVKLKKLEFLKEWAYIGFIFLFIGAFLTHVFNQDGRSLQPLVILAVIITSYMTGKKLAR